MKMLGNLLLVLGTILGGIAAANSVRPWRWLSLEEADREQFLFEDVPAAAAPEGTEPAAVLATADTPLEAAVVANLRAAGVEKVKVKDPPRDTEDVALAPGSLDAAVGRVLAEDVPLGSREEQIPAGRRLTAILADDLILAGVDTVEVTADEVELRVPVTEFREWVDDEGERDELLGVALPLLGETASEQTAAAFKTLVDGAAKLSAGLELALPDVAEAGRFVDEPLAQRIAEAGHTIVSVKITRTFSWSDWSWKWGFLAALASMVLGIAAKRSESGGSVAGTAATPQAPTATPRELLADLERKVSALAAQAESLSAEEIHAAVDPLLLEECYVLAAGRGVLQAALGVAGFAEVFGPYSTAERRLNRAWSASVDGHAGEARAALQSAAPELGRALAALPPA